MTLELWPVWWRASPGSRSRTTTRRPVRTAACAVARPTIPPPTTRTSNLGVALTAGGYLLCSPLAGGPPEDAAFPRRSSLVPHSSLLSPGGVAAPPTRSLMPADGGEPVG